MESLKETGVAYSVAVKITGLPYLWTDGRATWTDAEYEVKQGGLADPNLSINMRSSPLDPLDTGGGLNIRLRDDHTGYLRRMFAPNSGTITRLKARVEYNDDTLSVQDNSLAIVGEYLYLGAKETVKVLDTSSSDVIEVERAQLGTMAMVHNANNVSVGTKVADSPYVFAGRVMEVWIAPIDDLAGTVGEPEIIWAGMVKGVRNNTLYYDVDAGPLSDLIADTGWPNALARATLPSSEAGSGWPHAINLTEDDCWVSLWGTSGSPIMYQLGFIDTSGTFVLYDPSSGPMPLWRLQVMITETLIHNVATLTSSNFRIWGFYSWRYKNTSSTTLHLDVDRGIWRYVSRLWTISTTINADTESGSLNVDGGTTNQSLISDSADEFWVLLDDPLNRFDPNQAGPFAGYVKIQASSKYELIRFSAVDDDANNIRRQRLYNINRGALGSKKQTWDGDEEEVTFTQVSVAEIGLRNILLKLLLSTGTGQNGETVVSEDEYLELFMSTANVYQAVGFDLEVLNPEGITLTNMWWIGGVTGSRTMRLYRRDGTAAGNLSNPSGWTLIHGPDTRSLTNNVWHNMSLATPVHLPQGVHGIYLTPDVTGGCVRYVSGSPIFEEDDHAKLTSRSLGTHSFSTEFANFRVPLAISYEHGVRVPGPYDIMSSKSAIGLQEKYVDVQDIEDNIRYADIPSITYFWVPEAGEGADSLEEMLKAVGLNFTTRRFTRGDQKCFGLTLNSIDQPSQVTYDDTLSDKDRVHKTLPLSDYNERLIVNKFSMSPNYQVGLNEPDGDPVIIYAEDSIEEFGLANELEMSPRIMRSGVGASVFFGYWPSQNELDIYYATRLAWRWFAAFSQGNYVITVQCPHTAWRYQVKDKLRVNLTGVDSVRGDDGITSIVCEVVDVNYRIGSNAGATVKIRASYNTPTELAPCARVIDYTVHTGYTTLVLEDKEFTKSLQRAPFGQNRNALDHDWFDLETHGGDLEVSVVGLDLIETELLNETRGNEIDIGLEISMDMRDMIAGDEVDVYVTFGEHTTVISPLAKQYAYNDVGGKTWL